MKLTHFENFSKWTPAFAGVVGGLFLKLNAHALPCSAS